ncbi:peptide chain release factor N(5)-glutamine methyltransferase [Paracoccus jeotgali]|uniref:peptide chain release factor N(5)-glutamine methyltransferase n=1 Tax=Paracoccus jeotgali TaxID=2065379 RepID=UPI0028A9D808|nr:peptide chain release factor N(5)-glutamine methyltransferase [Paracoccus jeotgali]
MSQPDGADEGGFRAQLAAAVARLTQAGVADAPRDARLLIAHALDLPVTRLGIDAPARLTPAQQVRLAELIARRAARQPISQIIGRRAFWKHDFHVTPDTLDPRPETETLVQAALRLDWASVLDLGTGTGAILISLLAERPQAAGLGTDISDAALAVARGNAARLGVTADFTRADWVDGVTGRFDLIVSNPPYIALSEMAALSPEVREFEPHGALTDFGDGLSAYRRIAAGAAAHLTPNGAVLVEIGWQQGQAVAQLFAEAGASVRVLPDLDGRDRVIEARFGPDPVKTA